MMPSELPATSRKEAAMITISATDLAIRIAKANGTLRVTQHEGRFGAYWAISDDRGLIEVALSEAEAQERVSGQVRPATRLV